MMKHHCTAAPRVNLMPQIFKLPQELLMIIFVESPVSCAKTCVYFSGIVNEMIKSWPLIEKIVFTIRCNNYYKFKKILIEATSFIFDWDQEPSLDKVIYNRKKINEFLNGLSMDLPLLAHNKQMVRLLVRKEFDLQFFIFNFNKILF